MSEKAAADYLGVSENYLGMVPLRKRDITGQGFLTGKQVKPLIIKRSQRGSNPPEVILYLAAARVKSLWFTDLYS